MVDQAEMFKQLQLWNEAKEKLKIIKDQEMVLRKECLKMAFPDGKTGANTMPLGGGWKLTGTYKLNYSFDESTLDLAIHALAEVGVDTKELIRVKREPAMTAVNKMSKDTRKILEAAMITKPGTPTLVLVEPKAKK